MERRDKQKILNILSKCNPPDERDREKHRSDEYENLI
jgi:hypothetical protein